MGEETLLDKFKDWLRGIAWWYLLWSRNMTEDQYWDIIYDDQAVEQYKKDKLSRQNER